MCLYCFFFFQAEDGIRDVAVTGVQTCALPIFLCAAGLVYRLAPSDVAAAQAVVLAFLALGVGAVYVLAHGLGGATEGVVAALVFAPAPFVAFASLHFQPDLPPPPMAPLLPAGLPRTDAFGHPAWAVAP